LRRVSLATYLALDEPFPSSSPSKDVGNRVLLLEEGPFFDVLEEASANGKERERRDKYELVLKLDTERG
jgi:hypothetical protein